MAWAVISYAPVASLAFLAGFYIGESLGDRDE